MWRYRYCLHTKVKGNIFWFPFRYIVLYRSSRGYRNREGRHKACDFRTSSCSNGPAKVPYLSCTRWRRAIAYRARFAHFLHLAKYGGSASKWRTSTFARAPVLMIHPRNSLFSQSATAEGVELTRRHGVISIENRSDSSMALIASAAHLLPRVHDRPSPERHISIAPFPPTPPS